jgi:endonuclease/exonuclease/phosphatase family metal-dependent hydrolase
MRVGTWNVEYAAVAAKNERRVRRIRDMNADVWVLTETNDELNLGEGYRPVSTTRRVTGRAGGRWTTIWSRFPIVRQVSVRDENRTVAAIVQAPLGELLVYGTVMPWHSDLGPSGNATNWSEHHRVVPEQAEEWRALCEAHPGVALCVAGDFNMNLGGKHHYGTKTGRELLRSGLEAAGLVCITETNRIPSGKLRYSPIDHIVLSKKLAPFASVVEAWEGTDGDGVRLSDHSGLVVESWLR